MPDRNRAVQELCIRPLRPEEIPVIEDIAAAAWAPIYEHFDRLQMERFGELARPARIENKREQVRSFAARCPDQVLVSEYAGVVVGFITFTIDEANRIGVIQNNAVHPDYAGRGIGTAQYERLLELFRERGLRYASVTTGLDDSHAPARRAYEKAGFVAMYPSIEYMRKL